MLIPLISRDSYQQVVFMTRKGARRKEGKIQGSRGKLPNVLRRRVLEENKETCGKLPAPGI